MPLTEYHSRLEYKAMLAQLPSRRIRQPTYQIAIYWTLFGTRGVFLRQHILYPYSATMQQKSCHFRRNQIQQVECRWKNLVCNFCL